MHAVRDVSLVADEGLDRMVYIYIEGSFPKQEDANIDIPKSYPRFGDQGIRCCLGQDLTLGKYIKMMAFLGLYRGSTGRYLPWDVGLSGYLTLNPYLHVTLIHYEDPTPSL